jgi:hypothetical protein
MPLISGPITAHGAIVDLFISESQARKDLLAKLGMPSSEPVHARALIDTGATVSGFAPRLFRLLGMDPLGKIGIITPSTPADKPFECDQYHVGLSLEAGGRTHFLADFHVIATDSWHPEEGFEGLIGRDILQRCFFQYIGQDRRFTLAF